MVDVDLRNLKAATNAVRQPSITAPLLSLWVASPYLGGWAADGRQQEVVVTLFSGYKDSSRRQNKPARSVAIILIEPQDHPAQPPYHQTGKPAISIWSLKNRTALLYLNGMVERSGKCFDRPRTHSHTSSGERINRTKGSKSWDSMMFEGKFKSSTSGYGNGLVRC
ncbi:hypothetical protein ElyMa_003465700 [Elysia marginata]|uniref:Uncharacterized protein n=1 Tax=Elysia marginata TaxID=1093978 RepID=A0AAV4EA49_9GAST|nr:hypothetical protein ElyMa_003465700 [Elysia marginata]